MSVKQIANFEEILQPFLSQKQKVSSYKITYLNAPGKNHTSSVLAVEASLSDGTSLHLCAKLIPPSDVIQYEATFHNEFTFYNIIIPILKRFQKEEDVEELDFIPQYFGGRLSLNPTSKKGDYDAVILLENFKVNGYHNANRIKGFDLGTTRQILHNLASLHAISLGFKFKHPELFAEKIKPTSRKFRMNGDYDEIKKLVEKIINIIAEDLRCAPLLEKVKERFKDLLYYDKSIRETFATIIHCNCWINNVMVKVQCDGAIDTKLIDFQKYSYGSLAQDLIFFLFSSVETQVMEECSNGLIEFYHSNFLRVLQELKCDITLFSLEALLEEMKTVAKESQFIHILIHLHSIFFNKDTIKPNEELTQSDLAGSQDLSILMKEKTWFVVQEFAKRKWI